MRNLYVTDLKRILKDKLFVVTCILAGVFAVVNPLLNKVIFEALDLGELLGNMVNAKSMLFSAFIPGDNLGLIMPILIAIIVSKDFSQGTVRNKIISGRSRTEIFISHLLASATVMCVLMLLHALLTLGVSLCFFPYQATDFTAADLGYLMASLAFEMLVYFAIAAIVTFIATVAKNMGICILLYLAVSFGFSIVGAVLQVAGALLDPANKLYGVFEFLNALNIYTSTLIGAGATYSVKQVLYILTAPIAITAVSTILGVRLFARKNLK
ncbi:MAG: hypothetical protein E7589_06920 [Ruminococcaceae bacterium]|nr:hypothetical protein [Oscillospiraceae bacterium]